ncbi:MAG: TetR/AcrR family transcriptional regulator [Nocardioides sp.]|nr:TetR/AcrR family transcriptional regulator [Nocardioides sp.]
MSSASPSKRTRAPRADAARNRAALVEAARAAFTRSGETSSLEAIARAAGVGIGTLYRNFPTRDDLVAAVYASELDDVLATAEELRRSLPARTALRAWLDRYADFFTAKRGMVAALRAGTLAGTPATASTRERVNAAMASLLRAGAESGTLRDVPADDVTTAMLGIFLATDDPDQTARLLDLLVEGLRA